MVFDTIGNFLTVIRNGLKVSKPFVIVPHSKAKLNIADILKTEGFIRDYTVQEIDTSKKHIKILLKYVEGESVIHEIKRISKPGCRFYVKAATIPPIIGGLGLSIISTNKGIISHKNAKALAVGGELICTVW